MFSTGEQAGFEATIIRPDGTKFNEYDVKHSIDNEGTAVSECWLECEDDAGFQIKTERHIEAMTRFTTSQWRNEASVDGRELTGGVWNDIETPNVRRAVFTRAPGNGQIRKGLLTFSKPETTSLDAAGANQSEVMRRLGTIEIRLQPGTWAAGLPDLPICFDPIGVLEEGKCKLARITKSTNEQDYKGKHTHYDLRPHYPTTWQMFIFKYRHRAALEVMGVIEAPEVTPPPKAKPTNSKRSRPSESNINTDLKPNVRNAGPSRPSVEELQGDGSDSDEDDRAWKAAKAKRIKKLQAEIDKLKGGGRAKEKVSAKMKAKKDQPIDLCSDSD